ncbi:MAG: hypothetical protein ABS95_01315 [Verrucomicrobia bacterium SCN 57-15]|nr:MAG: hypothetical protein ABS95_01315 [Verrucomicrobia bacterium SCN 57-15]
MSKNYQNAVEHLHLFLADTKGESRDEVTRGLRAAGVDVERFVGDIKRIAGVRSGFSRVGRFANKTREEILKLLEELQVGTSNVLSGAGLATREGGDLNQLSDDELRALVEKLEAERPHESED